MPKLPAKPREFAFNRCIEVPLESIHDQQNGCSGSIVVRVVYYGTPQRYNPLVFWHMSTV